MLELETPIEAQHFEARKMDVSAVSGRAERRECPLIHQVGCGRVTGDSATCWVALW